MTAFARRVGINNDRAAMDGYFILEELAEYLGVRHTGSLRAQIARGALKAERIGKKTFIVTAAEARRYKEANRAGAGRRRHPVEETTEHSP